MRFINATFALLIAASCAIADDQIMSPPATAGSTLLAGPEAPRFDRAIAKAAFDEFVFPPLNKIESATLVYKSEPLPDFAKMELLDLKREIEFYREMRSYGDELARARRELLQCPHLREAELEAMVEFIAQKRGQWMRFYLVAIHPRLSAACMRPRATSATPRTIRTTRSRMRPIAERSGGPRRKRSPSSRRSS